MVSRPPTNPFQPFAERVAVPKLFLILRQGKGCAPLGEDPFKCINNEESVTGMSGDIGPVVTRAPGVAKRLLIFPLRS